MKKLQLNSPLIACLFFTFCFIQTKAQLTKVKGKVLDEFNTPMPFVNISFINSNVGTITDFDGMYFIETKWAKDSLTVSFVGYTKNFDLYLRTMWILLKLMANLLFLFLSEKTFLKSILEKILALKKNICLEQK